MRLVLVLAWFLGMSMVLTSCGSTSPVDSARSAVTGMRDTISAYNTARPRNLAETGNACDSAYSNLGQRSAGLTTVRLPSKYHAQASRLRDAYDLARSGFRECSRAARSNDYSGMITAQANIARANAAIAKARALDH